MPASADGIRIATFNTELSRKGPGLLLRDILRGGDTQVQAVIDVITETAPDILLLQSVDYDHGLAALAALRDEIGRNGIDYPHILAFAPNSGLETGLDRDRDGRFGEPEDRQAYGWFAGEGGMALLSRYPLEAGAAVDFGTLLWADLPGAIMPPDEAESSPAALVQRLSSHGHWVVPAHIAGQTLHLMAFHAAPPVFDGPEDRNGRRNHDEILFWRHYLDGVFGPAPSARFVVLGDANLDPLDGDGRKAAIRALLSDSRLQDPKPRHGGRQGGNDGHRGDPSLDTVAWPGPDPGPLRVSYILPSADLAVLGAGVHWPQGEDPGAGQAARASRHRLVWVDLVIE